MHQGIIPEYNHNLEVRACSHQAWWILPSSTWATSVAVESMVVNI